MKIVLILIVILEALIIIRNNKRQRVKVGEPRRACFKYWSDINDLEQTIENYQEIQKSHIYEIVKLKREATDA